MFKYQRIREEDYWVFPIVLFNIVMISICFYASVFSFRGPAIVLSFLGIWFTSNKIRRDYSPKRARLHIAITLVLGALLAFAIHVLTN